MDDTETPDDPAPQRREVAGYIAAGLLGLSAFTADTTYAWPDGSHGPFFAFHMARAVILLIIAVLVTQLVRRPNKPDVRIAKAGILASAIVAVVVGLNAFLTALDQPAVAGAATDVVPESFPGPAAWMLLAAGLLLVYLRFRRDIWPASHWELELRAASERRGLSRR